MEGSQDLVSQVWQKALIALESKLSRPTFESWLKNIKPISLEGEVLTIGVPSEFARDWLEKRATKVIKSAVRQVVGHPVEIKFTLAQMALDLEIEPAAPSRPPRRQKKQSDKEFSSIPLHPKYTFDSFVVGKGNQFAQAAALAVAKSPGKSYNPLFIYGGVGLGKTHLLQAIGHHVMQRSPRLQVAYISGDTFTYHVISSIREDRFGAFRSRYQEVDVWLVDDIQFIASRERTESEFFQVFNTLYQTNKQIVISSDRPPKELQVMDPRLSSRFEWGLIADIKPPDLETRIAILQKKAEMEGATVPLDVIRYIANIAQSNIRVLEGALVKVLAACSLTGTQITLPLAIEQLKDHSLGGHLKPITISTVQEVVAQYFKITVKEITAHKRTRELVFPRQLAMYLCRELLNCSFPAIGKNFGGKNHATVMHACTKIKGQMERDTKVKALVDELTNKLQTIF